MSASSIREKIIDYVIETTEASSLSSVHVSKLVKELGINRNTFYYHFDGKYDVAMYVLRHDLAKMLRKNVPESYLLESPVLLKPKSEKLPYYMHREIGARLLDHGAFFKSLVYCVQERSHFYRKLFSPSEQEFKIKVFELFRPAIEEDLRFVLGGRYMPPDTFDYLIAQQLESLYQIPCYHLANPTASKNLLDDSLNPFWNYQSETLMMELQQHPIRKPRS